MDTIYTNSSSTSTKLLPLLSGMNNKPQNAIKMLIAVYIMKIPQTPKVLLSPGYKAKFMVLIRNPTELLMAMQCVLMSVGYISLTNVCKTGKLPIDLMRAISNMKIIGIHDT